MTITDNSSIPLLETVDGVSSSSREGYRPVPDAATRRPFAWVSELGPADATRAVAVAKAAQPAWAAVGAEERDRILSAVADEIEANAEELARILSRETGKPLNGLNARFELGGCVAWLRATISLTLDPETIFEDGGHGAELHYEPLGVVAAIGPWNWPMMIAIWQIAPALKMGNAVVVKPSEYTPISVAALASVMNRHLPEGVLTVVSGGADIGTALVADPAVAKVMFTGSTATGRRIIEASAGNLARLTLELGGNDAAIVLPDADPAEIADGLFWGAFVNTGQTCAAIKRLYVHDSIHDAVVAELARRAADTPIGNGLDEDNMLGPLQNQRQFDIVSELVADARAHGATVVTGGGAASELGPCFFQPTIVTDVTDGVRLVDEEQFGPALPIIRFHDLDEVIARANRSAQGLGASIWSGDAAAARALASRIEAGTVWINQHSAPHPLVPFGGVKGSGYGLEFGVEGLKAVARPKVISY